MEEVQRLNPRTVLDLGVGFGLYGVACRQVLDGQHGRCAQETWQAEIRGAEAFEGYENPAWDCYSSVYLCDFVKYESATWRYGHDLVLMIDSLEHIEPEVGRPFLRSLVEHNKHVIVSVPNGRMDQGAVHDNEYERHRWTFTGLEEFEGFAGMRVLHRGVCTVVSIPGLHIPQ